MKIGAILTLTLIFSVSELAGQTVSEHERQAIMDEVQNIAIEMLRHLRNRDAASVLSIYGRPDRFVHVDNGIVIPWVDLEPQVRTYLKNADRNEIYWLETPTVVVLSPDAVVVYGTHRFESDSTGEHPHVGEWTGVFQLIDERWRLVHSHSSDRAAGHSVD